MLTRLARLGKPVHVADTIFFQRQHNGARGSAGARFDGANAQAQAIRYGGSVIREWRQSLPLQDWTPGFARDLSGVTAERAALLQRGLTCAQRSLWPEAVQDIAVAAELAPNLRATPAERELARVVIRNAAPWPILADDRISTGFLRRVANDYGWGQEVVGEMTRPLVWHARKLAMARDLRSARRPAGLLFQILGNVAAARRVAVNIRQLLQRSRGSRACWDSQVDADVIHAADGPRRADGHPVGEDGTALPG